MAHPGKDPASISMCRRERRCTVRHVYVSSQNPAQKVFHRATHDIGGASTINLLPVSTLKDTIMYLFAMSVTKK